MAKKSEKYTEKIPWLQESTRRTIYGLLSLVASIFFVLAYIGTAGRVGQYTVLGGEYLFGVGYLLLPLSCLLLGIAFLRAIKQSLTIIHMIGTAVFLGSSLGLVHILYYEKGGLVGMIAGAPLLYLFDVYASVIFLFAAIAISLLLLFDAHLSLSLGWIKNLLFKKKEDGLTAPLKITGVKAETVNEKIDRKVPVVDADEDTYDDVAPVSKKDYSQQEIKIAERHKSAQSTGDVADIPVFVPSDKLYVPPPLALLVGDKGKPEVGDIKANANIIQRTLQNFGILVEMDEVSIGPSVTRYALKPAEGVKLARIVALQNDLSLALAAHPIRIEAPIPGKSLVGIEIPNKSKTTVGLANLLSEDEFRSSEKPLMFTLGRGISGKAHFANLAKAPHMLIAGATGSGKSVTIHAVLTSLLYRNGPENLKFIMIDPKRVELTLYNKIPHLLTPVITDPKKAITSLKWAAKEMDRRYDILEQAQVRDIESYHKNVVIPALDKKKKQKETDPEEKPIETMPYIVVVIDELADIMQSYPRELEAGIVRLAQMSRAVGIHLILSTQRPSVNVITGLIKANVPTRIALQVASQIDSRTILDAAGAEKLLGAGDMLFMSGDMAKPSRIQSAYISENELKKITQYLSELYKDEVPTFIDLSPEAVMQKDAIFEASFDEDEEDVLYEEAKRHVVNTQVASTSGLQRKFGIGFSRAGRLIDTLERKGVVGPGRGAKPRDVLIKPGQDGDGSELTEAHDEPTSDN